MGEKEYEINLESFEIGTVFEYNVNKNVILGIVPDEGVFNIDIEWDPEFSSEDSKVVFTSWESLELELLATEQEKFLKEKDFNIND